MDNQTPLNIPPVQPLPQTPINPSTSWSKIVFFILLGLIVVVGVVIAGIKIAKNQKAIILPAVINPTIEPKKPSSDINSVTDWKTYINTQYGYQISYPSNWEQTEEIYSIQTFDGKEVKETVIKLFNDIYEVYIDSENKAVVPPVDKWIADEIEKKTKCTNCPGIFMSLNPNQTTKIADLSTIAVDGGNEGLTSTEYYFTYKNKVYSITTTVRNPEYSGIKYETGEPAKTYSKILSTFKFTDSTSSIPADWKTYIFKSNEFSFQYPSIWYPNENQNYPGGNNISFFLNGSKADHGFGDHVGNEVFSLEISDDKRTLQELKNNYYPTATVSVIAGKDAIITSFNLYIIKMSSSKNLTIVGGIKAADLYRDQILSTLKFTN